MMNRLLLPLKPQNSQNISSTLITLVIALFTAVPWTPANACGGFFCQLIPIDQAGEQIVFRQDGDFITAMVQIQYVGESEDFSWVVPVPDTPDFSIGSDQVFTQLETATRPDFQLQRTGEPCPVAITDFDTVANSAGGGNAENGDGGVQIVKSVEVGPFNATVIESDDTTAMVNWLTENNYDLNNRGRELIAPYVEANMKFVALKLRNGESAGTIKPIILKYRSSKPEVPIRLTAVAAVEDMGVLVWLVGDARAVPENYLHVTPNYTRLNWYTGTRNAYASYQSLITEAMEDANGQGFATDYAGRFPDLASWLPQPAGMQEVLNNLQSLSDSAFIVQAPQQFSDPLVATTISTRLPLPQGQTATIYSSEPALSVNYTAQQLAETRAALETAIDTRIIKPTRESVNLLTDGRYLTRLYTTLSADDMTLDPSFVFNADMEDQPLQREATLNAECTDQGTSWKLTLGSGTGRNDELVIDAQTDIPTVAPAIAQDASWKIETTFAQGQPTVGTERNFTVAALSGGGANGSVVSSSGGGAVSPFTAALIFVSGICGFLRRR